MRQKCGLTLIELLVAIVVTSILFGVVVLMLRTSLESFFIGQEDLQLQKAIDTILTEITGESLDAYGLIDAAEFLYFSKNSIKFIPLWVDEPAAKSDNKRFSLTRQFQLGRPAPLVEVKFPGAKEFKPQQAAFYHRQPENNLKDDIIEFDKPLALGAKVKAVYVPDKISPDVIFSLYWDEKKGILTKTYKNKANTIPAVAVEGIKIKEVHFEYFDNTNKLVDIGPKGTIDADLFSFVTAISVFVKVELNGKFQEGFGFINIRNSRSSGSGIVIREGTHFKIPDSYHIRTFSISNIAGVAKPGVIEFEARPKIGNIYKVTLKLDIKDNKPLIEKYVIEYPKGQVVYAEDINMTADLALNFLSLGTSGRYDYDFDDGSDGTKDAVLLKGDVELVVTKMDCKGASLYLRP